MATQTACKSNPCHNVLLSIFFLSRYFDPNISRQSKFKATMIIHFLDTIFRDTISSKLRCFPSAIRSVPKIYFSIYSGNNENFDTLTLNSFTVCTVVPAILKILYLIM